MNKKGLFTGACFVCTAIAILLTSCESKTSLEQTEDIFEYASESVSVLLTMAMSDNGIFFVDNDHMLNFVDPVSGETVYVCSNPDCEHKPEYECMAFTDSMSEVLVDDEYIYLYGGDRETDEFTIYREDFDGENREKFVTIESFCHGYGVVCGAANDGDYIVVSFQKGYEMNNGELSELKFPELYLYIIKTDDGSVSEYYYDYGYTTGYLNVKDGHAYGKITMLEPENFDLTEYTEMNESDDVAAVEYVAESLTAYAFDIDLEKSFDDGLSVKTYQCRSREDGLSVFGRYMVDTYNDSDTNIPYVEIKNMYTGEEYKIEAGDADYRYFVRCIIGETVVLGHFNADTDDTSYMIYNISTGETEYIGNSTKNVMWMNSETYVFSADRSWQYHMETLGSFINSCGADDFAE